jgi:mono/diheme cytochrome c family protein
MIAAIRWAIHFFSASRIAEIVSLAAIGASCGIHCAQAATNEQPAPGQRSVWDGAYTAQQIQRGSAVYARDCATCHGPTLNGGEAPPLAGADFLAEWYGYSAGDLFERIRSTMPVTGPGSLSAQEYADVLAHLLSINKFPAGETELESAREPLKRIRIEAAKPKPQAPN